MRTLRLSWMAVASVAVLGCSSGDDDDSGAAAGDAGSSAADAGPALPESLSALEAGWLAPYLPAATQKVVHAIPESLLDEEAISFENDTFMELLDGGGARVGYGREFFTDVGCTAGLCRAIRFMVLFKPDGAFIVAFHNELHPEAPNNDFMKYWQNEHLVFTDEERAKLNALLADPPPELVAVTHSAALTTNATATAPTVQVYQPMVVRGAVFTCWKVLQDMLATQAIIHTVMGS